MSRRAFSPAQIEPNWQLVAVIEVDGIPKGQPRVKAYRRGDVTGVYTPGTANGWKEMLTFAAKPERPVQPMEGPIRVDAEFRFPRPQRLNRAKDPDGMVWCTAKPDRDNADKCILDVLKNLGFYRDDAQVCDGAPRKFYHAKGGRPGATITVYRWVESAD
jgi:Holliday junction resolvase RusA-like endonuclease